jgi:hypothetical protein
MEEQEEERRRRRARDINPLEMAVLGQGHAGGR